MQKMMSDSKIESKMMVVFELLDLSLNGCWDG